MSVYFIREQPEEYIKVGVSRSPPKRVKNLQTGNPRVLELLGWIQTEGQDYELEAILHSKLESYCVLGEWFDIDTGVVLDLLRRAGIAGFVAKNADAFEITGRDRDGVPEYLGVCKWVDLELYECCPYCGCMCGMHEQEASGMFHCLNCDELTLFDELPD